jgi:hypothetical protein
VIPELVRPFTHALKFHVCLYEMLPVELLRKMGLLNSTSVADAEMERELYVGLYIALQGYS